MASLKQAQALGGGPLAQACNFAVMTGVNAGISRVFKRIRRKEDVQSSMVAAFGSGALFSLVSGMGGPNLAANAVTSGVFFALVQGGIFQCGHMIPTLDVAKLFTSRGVKSTIITTPLNAHYFTKSVDRTNQLGFQMGILTVDFPAAAADLPEGCESFDQITSDDMIPNFAEATALLQDPLERILDEVRPDCLVADMFFPWATEAAPKFGIPRLVFHGTSFFALCALENMRLYKPHTKVSSDDEPFFVPDLPHQIKLTKMQLPEHERSESETAKDFARIAASMEESELLSYGAIFNSFYVLEPEYADYYRDVLKRRAWHIGPVSLCNREIEYKAQRGKEASIDQHECLKWLDLKKPNSVIYICFGSVAKFDASQLYEI
ncbi:hypothetical protein RHMOL_Rhmol11G0240700 [Rhododendron molle]|uniref:Uncharacterized protein n=1 Tax=Rhododendron molle TaxID=49168 RepID=A0ACC0LW28_RHOML|nr:hypothetical protein RHMOL_Rhmol11G0240700 [Rhododendron molle]